MVHKFYHYPSKKNCQNHLSHPSLFHIEQKCQESLIQWKIHNQQSWRPQIFVKLSFREFYKWSDLTWPCKGPKFNLYHFQKISMILTVAMLIPNWVYRSIVFSNIWTWAKSNLCIELSLILWVWWLFDIPYYTKCNRTCF